MSFASGKYALAICDRCGFEYKYTSLKKEWTGFRVCNECFEVKHPQLEPVNHVADAQALQNPRPAVNAADVDANQMMSTTGDPIGSEFSQDASTGEIGTVTVVIT
jgi:PHP family Zn ribbon phosphoesterase